MHKPRTNTNILEINQSLIELMAEWRISEKDDELIFTKIVGLQLKKIRLIKGYTQTRVAKAINITFQQIQKYERGTNEVKSINLKKLSEYFDVSFDYWIKPILDANLTFLTKGERMYIRSNKTLWQDKRIKSMNRIIEKYNLSTEIFIEEYNRVCVSKAENKKQYKGENNDNR